MQCAAAPRLGAEPPELGAGAQRSLEAVQHPVCGPGHLAEIWSVELSHHHLLRTEQWGLPEETDISGCTRYAMPSPHGPSVDTVDNPYSLGHVETLALVTLSGVVLRPYTLDRIGLVYVG